MLLADGNIGIGGDPVVLLRRAARAARRRTATSWSNWTRPGRGLRHERVRLRPGHATSRWFTWAWVGADAIAESPLRAGLRVDAGPPGARPPLVRAVASGRMKLPIPPTEEQFKAPAHDERVTSKIGLALAVTFTICFVTGLISHLIQHPPAWFFWPSRPVGLYRVTQGLHVISGIASIPLLLAKLWSVYPKLFGRPLVRSLPHALERLSILVLSGAAFFELTTGC